ncbi:MAG: hypothetical protein ACHRXM_02420 [Isosphaerales bacterium]
MSKKPAVEGESPKPATTPTVQLSTNPVMAGIEPKPLDYRHYAVLVGYVGEVSSDTVQVYPQLDLRTYFQIPRDAIVYAEPVNPSQQSSATKLVVDATVKIEVVKAYSRSIEAGFLAGSIAASNLGAARTQMSAETDSPSPLAATEVAYILSPLFRGPIPPSFCGRPCLTDPL